MAQTRTKTRKLIIFGIEDFADIAYEYFTHDSDYEVVAFTVDSAYLTADSHLGLPVIAFEDLAQRHLPGSVDVYAAIVYGCLNRVREDICHRVKAAGYRLASYISTRAFVWHNVKLGEHCFIFEDNTVQPYASIGDNVIMWSGNHIGHHSRIGNHCFISSHVVVSGWADVGTHCFLGVNATLANNTRLGGFSWVSHGACLAGEIPSNSIVRPTVAADVKPLNEAALFRSLARASRVRAT